MKRLWAIVVLVMVSIALVGCYPSEANMLTAVAQTIEAMPTATSDRWPSKHTPQPSSGSSQTRQRCTKAEYKSEAIPHMQRIRELAEQTSLYNEASVKKAKNELPSILKGIRSMKCADAFPLKQETLEYTAIHFNNALDSFLADDLVKMNESMDSAVLNTEWFYDWSLDMD